MESKCAAEGGRAAVGRGGLWGNIWRGRRGGGWGRVQVEVSLIVVNRTFDHYVEPFFLQILMRCFQNGNDGINEYAIL